MTKISLSLIICLLLFSIPLILLAQLDDLWMPDNMLLQDTIEQEINLKTLELYWSADTYVPFGYQGRALATKGSLVTVEADLDIVGGDPENLKYSWFLDDIFQGAKSGYGQDKFQFYVRRFNGARHTVLLKVFNESRSFLVEKSITIPITSPELVVHGDFDVIADKETSFLALPYFFNIKSLKDLEFEWTLGDKSVRESSFIANVFGLKIINKQVGGSLEETLRVIATNKRQTDQRVQKLIKINIY